MIVHQPLDAAVAFDMLSILAVKHAQTTGSAPATANLAAFSVPLSGQLGEQYGQPLFCAITGSLEYAALYSTNLALFNLIDWMKRPDRTPDECHDRRVDTLNYQRWQHKRALQQRFFPDQPLSEQKLGYGGVSVSPALRQTPEQMVATSLQPVSGPQLAWRDTPQTP
jgi:hypothetical protein